ncbi:MAG: DUF2207 domain-containing protein [Woeseiaceae bacterium]|nr:DUF2207 domain-containing protein [Woeseiaceae bacterium]NIP21733.1 DUF2207 domain-containing protein [Woeseiaceae bacterium]NIS90818.1 DUF2207 domain-containing protein [Woeseiaceae bacterium]
MRKFLLGLLLLPFVSAADERILEFHSDILVMADGWIEVTETIRVRAEGNRIRRGIYRDFPTEYRDRLGNDYVVDFDVLSVLRNAAPESFHSQPIRDGVRTYFGSSARYIDAGEHTYVFRYRASRMLGFFENHDELYWNVTGVNWEFPIDRASAAVRFAFEVAPPDIATEAYTGAFGYTNRDYNSRLEGDGSIRFETTKPLAPLSGLTIVVGWPKGFVAQPSDFDRLMWLLEDNANLLILAVGFAILLGYYVPVWRHFGRDPDEGVLVTRYEPPDGFSPASLRYIRQMYYDDKVMTAAIVNLAVKGYLRIDVEEGSDGFLGIGAEEDEYILVKTEPVGHPLAMAAGEQELYDELFRGRQQIKLVQDNHEKLGDAKSAHSKSLARDYKEHYFKYNGLLNIPAILILVLAIVMSVREGITVTSVFVMVLMAITMIVFAIIMKRPTMRGRKLLDEMLGFKDYLEIAEKYEMELRNPPEKTPQLFEKYLPFALALGIEQTWSEKFSTVLQQAQQPDGTAYHPSWYNGSWNNASLRSTTNSLSSSLNSAITHSVSPPGSSSGGGGGGFSGGGGGGGGGGGW